MKNERKAGSDRQSLQDFALDIQCLDALYKWSESFNVFDVLGIYESEIRHSKLLRWLLDPNENHKLGDQILRGLIRKLAPGAPEIDLFKIALMDLTGVQVLREWRHIDLLVISHEEEFLLAIENKVNAAEHDNQLSRYRDTLEKEYPGYQKLYAFLTPNGRSSEEATEQEVWQELSYLDVMEIIESAKNGIYMHMPVDPVVIIDEYIDTVRRHIVGDMELQKICQQIYAKHCRALDLIYEYRNDAAAQVAEAVRRWCEEKAKSKEIVFDPEGAENSGKTYIRFTTPCMTALLPELEESNGEWKTKSIYYYEVINHGDDIKVVLAAASKNLSEEQRRAVDALSDLLKRKDKRPDWVWKRLHNWKKHDIAADPMSEELDEEIGKTMDRYWQEITAFEKETIQKLKEKKEG